jgi:single-strand DNA-binding protein
MSVQISVVGTVATAPKLLNAAAKAAFCTFRVASNERRFDREKGEWVDGETTWLSVNAFRSLAEHAHESFSVGDRVIINGKLRVKRWENNDRKGVSVELDADGLGHDLRWGVSKFTKRTISGASAEGATAIVAEPSAETTTDTESGAWLAAAPNSEQSEYRDGFVPDVAA